jgi:hypothetical protein
MWLFRDLLIINSNQIEKYAMENQTTPRAIAVNYLREQALKVERKRIKKEGGVFSE